MEMPRYELSGASKDDPTDVLPVASRWEPRKVRLGRRLH
jgi:hypothetical protein